MYLKHIFQKPNKLDRLINTPSSPRANGYHSGGGQKKRFKANLKKCNTNISASETQALDHPQ